MAADSKQERVRNAIYSLHADAQLYSYTASQRRVRIHSFVPSLPPVSSTLFFLHYKCMFLKYNTPSTDCIVSKCINTKQSKATFSINEAVSSMEVSFVSVQSYEHKAPLNVNI